MLCAGDVLQHRRLPGAHAVHLGWMLRIWTWESTTMTISEKPRSGCVQGPCLCWDIRKSRSANIQMESKPKLRRWVSRLPEFRIRDHHLLKGFK
jgi:hypothetical protein